MGAFHNGSCPLAVLLRSSPTVCPVPIWGVLDSVCSVSSASWRSFTACGTCGFGLVLSFLSEPLKKIFSTANYKAFPTLSLNTGLDCFTLCWFLLCVHSSEAESGPCSQRQVLRETGAAEWWEGVFCSIQKDTPKTQRSSAWVKCFHAELFTKNQVCCQHLWHFLCSLPLGSLPL